MTTMESGIKNLEKSILEWVNTFNNISRKVEIVEDLLDGQILAKIINTIVPNYLDMTQIVNDPEPNMEIKVKNLRYIYERIGDYYVHVLEQPFDQSYVNIVSLVKERDNIFLANLMEYILGMAINCEQKEYYIQVLMTLEENTQTELMYLLEKIVSKCETKSDVIERSSSIDMRASLIDRSHSLNMIKNENKEKILLFKLDELENENQVLKNKLDETNDDRDKLKAKLSELNLEIIKKSEEIKHLNSYKEQIMNQISAQEINEDLQNEVKFKEKKIIELNKYVDELRGQYENQILALKDDLDNYKKKIAQLSKLEITVDFYKQKFEDCAILTEKVTELENEIDIHQSKIHDYEKQIIAMNAKIKKYIDQYTAEKDKCINFELAITKKDAELEMLRNDKKAFELTVSELEAKINYQNRLIEQYKHDLVDTAGIKRSTEQAMTLIASQNIPDFGLSEEDSSNPFLRIKNGFAMRSAELETEKALIKKENELLSEKCKQLQVDNELLKIKNEGEIAKQLEKLTKENEALKEEINNFKSLSGSSINEMRPKEIAAERKLFLEEIEALKQKLEVATKAQQSNTDIEAWSKVPDNYLEELRKLHEVNDNLKEENEVMKKSIMEYTFKINELKNEIECQKQIFNELDNLKEEEVRGLSAAFHELAIKNFDLEKKIATQLSLEQKYRNANPSPSNGSLKGKNIKKK